MRRTVDRSSECVLQKDCFTFFLEWIWSAMGKNRLDKGSHDLIIIEVVSRWGWDGEMNWLLRTYWFTEEFMWKLSHSVLGCRFDAVAEQMRGAVLDNSFMGDECVVNRSKANRKIYRIPANIESYEISVRDFSLCFFPVLAHTHFLFITTVVRTFFSLTLIWSIRWKHLRILRRTY